MSAAPLPWSTAWRIARRDLNARFRGLRLLLVCLFLGVGAIAAIGTLTGSIERELATRGRAILGGDIELQVWQRGLNRGERQALAALGRVSSGTRMQAMASANDSFAPVELKAVDERWPMVGRLRLKDGREVGAPSDDGTWIAEGAAERLGVKVGDRVTIGGQRLTVEGVIDDEPDRLSEGLSLGTVAIVRDSVPEQAGLTAPGAMFRTKVRVVLPSDRDPEATVEDLQKRFPDAGFNFRTRDRAAPGAERFVSRMGEFLVLVGLAALAIAGIGIGGGVSSYLEARRASIATFKVLGATSGDIARIYVLQIGAAAIAGSMAGLAVGVLVTPLLAQALGTLLPVTTGFVFAPWALLRAAAYGLLVALIFAAPPLARARTFPAMALMRARVSPLALPRKAVLLPVGLGLAAIVALALASAAQIKITALFLAGTAGVLALLGGLGWAIRRLAARLPRPRGPLLRAGLANLHRPGAQTGALVTALGFGLSAFVLLAAIQTSLEANIAKRIPQRAPDYFVLDVPKDRVGAFEQAVHEVLPRATLRTVPALRGAIIAYGPEGRMTRVADLKTIPEKGWALRGERGLTYSQDVPEGNSLVAGQWWPKAYAGPPLVSVDEELAKAVGLKLGDRITVAVLGVERTATVASLRRLDWENMGFNYVLVFSPNTLADAPHNLAATIDVPAGDSKAGLLRKLAQAFPATSVIETGGILKEARALLSQMSAAILAAASVAVLAGLAVLLGAIAAARASRTYDNVILRVLGASRRQLLLLQMAEYGLLAGALSLVALVLGSGVAWAIVTQMFEFDWLPDWTWVLIVLGTGLVLVLGFALAGSLPLLRAKPAQALREL
ncbi:ABC transporter permease [Novosphingobium sp. JCM 18896]|uniref:ABC transporter permease n=1 Tax=Novosphingobium sp. JCM 18896 TaxID=2989731 RepID=UPI002221AC5F|nr:FtsX-like permease family protein [Novosphingobium sp. JCM 18896]MCW1429943.1 FtsX-like permease family protein [Novosphingobium sp. JCM 18896]